VELADRIDGLEQTDAQPCMRSLDGPAVSSNDIEWSRDSLREGIMLLGRVDRYHFNCGCRSVGGGARLLPSHRVRTGGSPRL
jgi:hypothetical protein